MILGQRVLLVLRVGWLLCLVLTVAAGFLLNEDVVWQLLGVLLVLSVALVAAPGILFLVYAERHPPGSVPREMRRSALGSGASGLFAAAVLWSFPRPAWIFMVPGAVLGVVAAVTIYRALRLAPPDASAPPAPALRHRGVTVTGVVTIVLFVLLAAKL